MDNLIGKRLDGRYSIESLVGVGGMANVYRGTDLKTGNQIAVKVLKDEFLDNEELVRRFKNESKAISINRDRLRLVLEAADQFLIVQKFVF